MALIKVIFHLGLFLHLFGQVHCTVSCHFDDGLCGWRVVGNSSYSWRTQSGETMDRTSGPLNDVTCKNANGKYAYIPGIFSKKDERAILESEQVTLTNKTLFAFWYLMNGVGIGAMEIIQTFENGTTIKVWSKQGAQNIDWQRGQVLIEPGTFSMKFQGYVRLPYGSDMAIDNVKLEAEITAFNTSHCMKTTPHTTTQTTTTLTPKPTKPTSTRKPYITTKKPLTDRPHVSLPTNDLQTCKFNQSSVVILPGSCNFENGSCDLEVYANEDDAKVTWLITDHRDEYDYIDARIPWDHTLKNSSTRGHYLAFQNHYTFTLHSIARMASVNTPVLNSTSVCLSFWYIMPTKKANLLVSINDTDGNVIDVWKSENMTKQWTNAIISITNRQHFKILFQTTNKGFNAKVALDDIVIVESNHTSTIVSLNTTKPTTLIAVSATVSGTHHGPIVSALTSALPNKPPSSLSTNPSRRTTSYSTVLTRPMTSTTEQNKLTKKPTESTTKKNVKLAGKNDKQTSHKFRNSSTVIGYSVGGLVIVTVIAIVAYVARKRMINTRLMHQQKKSPKPYQNGHANKGFTATNLNIEGMTEVNSGVTRNGVKMNGSRIKRHEIVTHDSNVVSDKSGVEPESVTKQDSVTQF